MSQDKVKVQGKEMSKDEFIRFQEDLSKDSTKKLKKISESEYTVLQKMNG